MYLSQLRVREEGKYTSRVFLLIIATIQLILFSDGSSLILYFVVVGKIVRLLDKNKYFFSKKPI